MTDLVVQVRTIASRGRMDDTDVQVIFDAADEIERLRGELSFVTDCWTKAVGYLANEVLNPPGKAT